MCRCDKCGRLFDEPVPDREFIGYWVSPCCETSFEESEDEEDAV